MNHLWDTRMWGRRRLFLVSVLLKVSMGLKSGQNKTVGGSA